MKLFYGLTMLALLLVWGCQSSTEEKTEQKASPSAKAAMRIGSTDVSINYNSPRVKGRKIWGALVPYNEIWRTGADEATVFSVSTDIQIDSLTLPAGKYALFTIPGESEWTIVLNKEFDQWGTFNYDASKDVLRFKAKPIVTQAHIEDLTFSLLDVAPNEREVKLSWEKLMIPFSFKVPQPK